MTTDSSLSGSVTIIVCCFSLVFERYKSYSPYDMLESIKKEVKGDLENAFLNLGKQVHAHTHTHSNTHAHPAPATAPSQWNQLSVHCAEAEQ